MPFPHVLVGARLPIQIGMKAIYLNKAESNVLHMVLKVSFINILRFKSHAMSNLFTVIFFAAIDN